MPSEEIVSDEDGELVIKRSLVSYLDGIQRGMAGGFAEIKTALDQKASREDLGKIETRLDEHTRQISVLEVWRHDKEVAATVHQKRDQRFWTVRNKVLGGLGGAAYVFATLIAPSLHIHW